MLELNKKFQLKILSKLIAKYINFNGKIVFDKNSPDGTYKKNYRLYQNKKSWLVLLKLILKKGLREVILKERISI